VLVLSTCRAIGKHQWCGALAPMVRRAKYLAVYYQSGDNLLLESTENEVNLSKIYPTFVHLKTIIYICSNINATLQEQQQNSYYSQTKTTKNIY
jgi:hypothetical protein